MVKIDKKELSKITYFNSEVIGDRSLNLMAFWDGSKWHQWFPTEEGLIELSVVDAVHADYVAKSPAQETDLLIPFVEFIWQRACWSDVDCTPKTGGFFKQLT